MKNTQQDKELWNNLLMAENNYYEVRKRFLSAAQSLHDILAEALNRPYERGTALRILLIIPEEFIKVHFTKLVDLVTVGHSDIELVRNVILLINKAWLINNIESYINQFLENGGEEEFRRVAEFYKILSNDLLKNHLERCATHPDIEVREISDDFSS